jgi:hypothetical protein
MAFSLIHNFRKYQKFWMASILLLCMITFVLCTGVGGDLSDLIIKTFVSRRGTEAATVNGSRVYDKDLRDLQIRRNLADVYMREATRFAIAQLTEQLNHIDKMSLPPAQRPAAEDLYTKLRKDLSERIGPERPRYFSGGVKYDDLLNFMLWLQQADRLGINLERDAVQALIRQSVYGNASRWTSEASVHILYQVRTNNYQASEELIYRALRDEFRVQIAQLALTKARPDLIFDPLERYPRAYLDLGGPPRNLSAAAEIRRPLAPEQLWEDYRKQCSGFDVGLIPVPVDSFVKDVPAPKDEELKDFYERNRDNEYNPTADKPSFKYPTRMKVQWVSANPKSPYYRGVSRAATTLEVTPAVAWYPMLPASLGTMTITRHARSVTWRPH